MVPKPQQVVTQIYFSLHFITGQYNFIRIAFTLELSLMKQSLSGTLPVWWLQKREMAKTTHWVCKQLSGSDACHFCLHFIGQRNLMDWPDIRGIEKCNPSLGYIYSGTTIRFTISKLAFRICVAHVLMCLSGYICFSIRILCAIT